MPTPQLAMPPSRRTIHPNNVRHVEQWASEQRAQLAQLRLHLRSLRAEAASIAAARVDAATARQELEQRFERELAQIKEDLLVDLRAVAVHANGLLHAEGAAVRVQLEERVVEELRDHGLPGEPPPATADAAFAQFWRDVDGDRPDVRRRPRPAMSA